MRTTTTAAAIALTAAALTACGPTPAPAPKEATAKPAPTPTGLTLTSTPTPDPQFVTIASCEKDDWGYPHAKLTVTNPTDRAANINAQIVFNGPDGTRLADAYALVMNLQPGGKADEEAMGLKQMTGEFTCKIGDVSRW